ncbi:efflux RND transporter periplasmic adaptor subunit [Alcanivorax quisquiliarum]|uniref:Efflux RND transporter periplasmic adaptor subunit n=1 Tax=Alcanivorax quisquiliarum TaxID=2933565 RepID=A0ABT0E3M7_9GAMM|nr:efflux RND transporter periplasmic adaptor subunit [Alcanivorax quisquiliarum]MCK0536428.1 efflux RND transporter periplasmic adaptor subunit [Alcanivorax quisquiliarum]
MSSTRLQSACSAALLPASLLLTAWLFLTACGPAEPAADQRATAAPVKAVTLRPAALDTWTLSGTVQAHIQSPLAFRVGGQIVARHINAGQAVRKGQPLLTLDEKDLQEQLTSARAQLNSARAEAANAAAESRRMQELAAQKLVSAQVADNTRTLAEAAQQQAAAAEAQWQQARNAMAYATLVAPADGVILDLQAQPGQVVTAGQPVALLAQDGPREVEVFVPQERRHALPEQALVRLAGAAEETTATLQEVSGAADPMTRTWRARYRLDPAAAATADLGSVARVRFTTDAAGAGMIYRVPLGALSERGEGARLWVIEDGQVQPHAVQVLGLDTEDAFVSTTLPPQTRIVALGTHLLHDGQLVRVID